MFGVVKTAHPSKLGDVQRMSYQMVNSLNIDSMDKVMEKSLEYVNQLKTDINVFIEHLRRFSTFANDFEVLVALYEQDHTFEQSSYFRERRRNIISDYVWNLKNGKLIQDADNLVIVGSPYAMLLHSVGESVEKDPTFQVEDGTIQCFTDRFEDGEYLAGFRSPHNSANNICYFHNVKHEYMKKYFKLGKLCMAVNVNHTDVQDRANGMDFDSDQQYVTNVKEIVTHAEYCYREQATIVNSIPKEINHYDYSLENFAIVDNKLAASQRAIGESSNLAQICLTYSHSMKDEKFKDYVCILAVLAQCAIDNAKRTFDVDIPAEIKRIKSEIDLAKNGYPAFWLVIRRGFARTKINPRLSCPMNKVYDTHVKMVKPKTPTLPMSDFFVKYELDVNKRKSRKVEDLIEKYTLDLLNFHTDDHTWDNEDSDLINNEYLLLRADFDKLVEDIRKMVLPDKYIGLMSWLLNRAFIMTPQMESNKNTLQTHINKNKSLLLKVLYTINPECLLKCFAKNVIKNVPPNENIE